ncbi:hypothetical protein J1605_018385 [Eschrichtius robustus]|uniref:N-acetyltransferase domain-containing protein n=1 Tax=Eschrichtius robustus TaxID=9764 RepID=A0AB34HW41_ESCRO|nr:hypothetical protein J1605_018385 [Eschrichtius robustus]
MSASPGAKLPALKGQLAHNTQTPLLYMQKPCAILQRSQSTLLPQRMDDTKNDRFSELNLIYPLQVQFRQDKNLISSLVTFNLTEHQLGPAEISNESAIDFYRKFGFEIIETKKNYYKRIEPADAHVLQKNLKVPSGQNADVQKIDN